MKWFTWTRREGLHFTPRSSAHATEDGVRAFCGKKIGLYPIEDEAKDKCRKCLKIIFQKGLS